MTQSQQSIDCWGLTKLSVLSQRMTALFHMMFMIVFTGLNFEAQSCPIYHVLLISSNWLGKYTLYRNSVFSTSHQVYLFSIRKWRTMCLSLLKEYEMLEVLLFFVMYIWALHCSLDPLFLHFFFLIISPVPIRVINLGKSHRADLFSRIQGMGRSSLTLSWQLFFGYDSESKHNKCKNQQMWLCQT